MRILADENIARTIVSWLRERGHDVLYAAESRAQAPGIDLLGAAESLGYVTLTEGKDFGELVCRDHRNSHGVILLRLDERTASGRLARVQEVWATVEANLPGRFLVMAEAKVRVRSLTTP